MFKSKKGASALISNEKFQNLEHTQREVIKTPRGLTQLLHVVENNTKIVINSQDKWKKETYR